MALVQNRRLPVAIAEDNVEVEKDLRLVVVQPPWETLPLPHFYRDWVACGSQPRFIPGMKRCAHAL
jgi:hypothetical protein